MKANDCFGEFVRYASFNVLGMIGLSCYILADTFFVAQGLGINGLTALNLAIPVYSLIHGSGLMIGIGGGTQYAIEKNRDSNQSTDAIFTNALYFAAFLAVFFVIAGLFFDRELAALLGADARVLSMTATYIRVLLLFAPAFLLNNVLLCFVRNDGAPQRSMAAMLIGSLSNVILDYILIFPCQLGIFGAVLATGLAPIISMLILSPHFIYKYNQFHVIPCKWSGKIWKNIFSGGMPSLITELSSGLVILIFNGILLSLQGNTGVAAYGVVANLSLVVVAIYTGIAQGIQPILSSHYGGNRLQNVASIFRYALISMVVFSVLIYAVVYFAASPIAAAFNSQQNALLQTIAVQGLKLYFIACPFVGLNVIISVYFTSTAYARPAHMISLLRGFFIIIPMAFFLANLAGIAGVWCAFPATEGLVALAAAGFYVVAKKNSAATTSQESLPRPNLAPGRRR